MRKPWLIVPLVMFMALLMLFALQLRRQAATDQSSAPFAPFTLPDFSLAPLYGEALFTDETVKAGAPAIINVFASWCVSCRAEHPYLFALKEKHGIPVYGLNWKDAPEAAKAWLEDFGNPYAQAGQDREGTVAVQLGITGAPETFVVDQDGQVIFRYAGPLDERVIKNQILPLMK